MNTKFNYQLSPYAAVIGDNFTFTLAVSNPIDGESESSVEIYVQFDNNLTSHIDDIHPASVDSHWSCVKQSSSSGIIFVIKPNDGITFEPGQTREFKFSNVAINDSTITAKVQIIERVAGSQQSTTIDVPKLAAKLGIIGYAKPVKVAKGQSSTLYFTANMASSITIEPTGQVIETEDQGNGKSYSAAVEVTPRLQDGDFYQQTYTLTAKNDAGDYFPFSITVTIVPPQVDSFDATPSRGVALDDERAVTLQWKTQYSNATYLQPQFGELIQVSNSGNHTFSGKQLRELLKNSPNQNTLTFTLTADNGHGTRVNKKITATLSDAQILYFKYKNPDLTQPIYAASNAVQQSYHFGGGIKADTYQVEGPNGPLTQYLGDASDTPQIIYFSPNQEQIKAGDTVTLNWVVRHIDSMVLLPGGVTAPIDSEGKGSLQVLVTQDQTYTLQASSGVTSTLLVTVSPTKK